MSARATSCACRFPTAPLDADGARRGVRTASASCTGPNTAMSSPTSPIEIVNIRVIGIGRMPKIAAPGRARAASLAEALVRTAHCAFRVMADCRRSRRRSTAAMRCRSTSRSPGRRSFCRPTRRRSCRPAPRVTADRERQSHISAGGMSDGRSGPIDSITASVVQGALENIAIEMGYKLMRMSYSSIIRESEDFGAALVDAEGRGPRRSRRSRRRCSRVRSRAISAAS